MDRLRFVSPLQESQFDLNLATIDSEFPSNCNAVRLAKNTTLKNRSAVSALENPIATPAELENKIDLTKRAGGTFNWKKSFQKTPDSYFVQTMQLNDDGVTMDQSCAERFAQRARSWLKLILNSRSHYTSDKADVGRCSKWNPKTQKNEPVHTLIMVWEYKKDWKPTRGLQTKDRFLSLETPVLEKWEGPVTRKYENVQPLPDFVAAVILGTEHEFSETKKVFGSRLTHITKAFHFQYRILNGIAGEQSENLEERWNGKGLLSAEKNNKDVVEFVKAELGRLNKVYYSKTSTAKEDESTAKEDRAALKDLGTWVDVGKGFFKTKRLLLVELLEDWLGNKPSATDEHMKDILPRVWFEHFSKIMQTSPRNLPISRDQVEREIDKVFEDHDVIYLERRPEGSQAESKEGTSSQLQAQTTESTSSSGRQSKEYWTFSPFKEEGEESSKVEMGEDQGSSQQGNDEPHDGQSGPGIGLNEHSRQNAVRRPLTGRYVRRNFDAELQP